MWSYSMLAQALRSKKSKATIHQLKTASGITLKNNPDIAQEFEHYYSSLYNLTESETHTPSHQNRTDLQNQFLEKHCPKTIPSETADNLDHPLSLQEWNLALKQLKLGKVQAQTASHRSITDTLAPPYIKAFNSLSTSTLPYPRTTRGPHHGREISHPDIP